MLCRSLQARRVVEFGTSYGVSTLYLAAAMRDQGGGLVIGTEIETEKARHARNHFAEAGVADLIELRDGDALATLKDCGGPVDFLLVDGFPKLARPVIELMAPQLRKGAIVVADSAWPFPKLRRLSGLCAGRPTALFRLFCAERRNRAFRENLIRWKEIQNVCHSVNR